MDERTMGKYQTKPGTARPAAWSILLDRAVIASGTVIVLAIIGGLLYLNAAGLNKVADTYTTYIVQGVGWIAQIVVFLAVGRKLAGSSNAAQQAAEEAADAGHELLNGTMQTKVEQAVHTALDQRNAAGLAVPQLDPTKITEATAKRPDVGAGS